MLRVRQEVLDGLQVLQFVRKMNSLDRAHRSQQNRLTHTRGVGEQLAQQAGLEPWGQGTVRRNGSIMLLVLCVYGLLFSVVFVWYV
jgi:hypothetical protein